MQSEFPGPNHGNELDPAHQQHAWEAMLTIWPIATQMKGDTRSVVQ
jgi:hypothetical protein